MRNADDEEAVSFCFGQTKQDYIQVGLALKTTKKSLPQVPISSNKKAKIYKQ